MTRQTTQVTDLRLDLRLAPGLSLEELQNSLSVLGWVSSDQSPPEQLVSSTASQTLPAEVLERQGEPSLPSVPDGGLLLRKLLKHPTMPSKPWLAHHRDPVHPDRILDGFGAAAPVLRVSGCERALVVTRENLAGLWEQDPCLGAQHAVCEAARNLAAVGAEPLLLLASVPQEGPSAEAGQVWRLQETVRGLATAGDAFGLPGVQAQWAGPEDAQGKDACIAPAVALLGVLPPGLGPCTPYFKQEGHLIGLLGEPGGALGGSVYQQVMGWPRQGRPAALRLDEERAVQAACREMRSAGILASAHAVAEGGLALALAECCLGPMPVGAQLELRCQAFSLAHGARRWDLCWFGEAGGRILISFPASHEAAVRQCAQRCSAPFHRLGYVEGASIFIPGVLDEPIALLADLYLQSFDVQSAGG